MGDKKTIAVLIIILAIGFASVSATLVLNGTIGISNKASDFNVIFTNALLDDVKRKDLIDNNTKQTITFESEKLTALNQETTLEYEIANTSRLYDAEVSIHCTADNNVNIILEYTPTSMKVESGKSVSGMVTARLIKASIEDKNISVRCELIANAVERESLGSEYVEPTAYELTSDTNNNGIADIGDEIKVGTERFHVISKTEAEINALAKYNLNVGNNANPNVTKGIQHETVKGYISSGSIYGTVSFSDSAGWPYANYATINIKNYDGPVKTVLYGENGYEKYIQQSIPDASVRLITKAELENLGCSVSNETCKSFSPTWVYSTSYWVGTADANIANDPWSVSTTGGFSRTGSYNVSNSCGVRPVLTIPVKQLYN